MFLPHLEEHKGISIQQCYPLLLGTSSPWTYKATKPKPNLRMHQGAVVCWFIL